MAFLKETVDFTSNGRFTPEDLDVAWAYLQVKELYDLEQASSDPKTINTSNFTQKVKEAYISNLASNVTNQANPVSDVNISKLPGFIKDGADLSIPKRIKMKNFWTFTDVKSTQGVFDAKTGLYSTFTNCNWLTGVALDQQLFKLNINGVLNLNDDGSLRNDRNWALFIRGHTRALTKGTIFRKGGFEAAITSTLFRITSGPSGAKWGERQHSYYVLGNINDYSYKNIDIVVVREGISMRVYVNGNELEMTVPSEQPEPMLGSDSEATLDLPGSTWLSLDKIYISDIDTTGDDIVSAEGVYTGLPNDYKYAHDLDLYESFFNFKSMIPDNAGGFGRVFGSQLYVDGNPLAKTEWEAPPSKSITNGYVGKTSCLALYGARYLNVPQVNFRKDFTISFWMSTAARGPILSFVGESGNGTFGYSYGTAGDTESQGITIWVKDFGTKKLPLFNNTGDQGNAWHHIVIVKSGKSLGVWSNGQATRWSCITLDEDAENTLGKATPKFKGVGATEKLYLSHIRVAEYAVMNPPVENIGRKSVWTEVDQLKNNIETQRLSSYVPDYL